jgi:integrase
VDDRSRLAKYALPYVGHISLDDVRPRHIRDMVRQLRELRTDAGEPLLAPRTIHHVYNTLHNVFEAAIVDEIYAGANPVKVAPGELPKKVDADPEWRSQATYTVSEVEQLLSAPLIPVERRVMYALKALAGLRHGEAAALCVRHLDFTAEPLPRLHVVQAWCSRHHVVKSTKTEETRTVPVHPELSKVLRSWLSEHWNRVYGRAPAMDDFIAQRGPVDVSPSRTRTTRLSGTSPRSTSGSRPGSIGIAEGTTCAAGTRRGASRTAPSSCCSDERRTRRPRASPAGTSASRGPLCAARSRSSGSTSPRTPSLSVQDWYSSKKEEALVGLQW